MMTEEYSAFLRGKIVGVCEAILKEEMGIIAGSRRLCSLEFEFGEGQPEWFQHDEDFIAFVAINSETDHLPVDLERRNWSIEALQRKDEEIAKVEALYKEDAVAACKILIARFDMKRGI